MAVSRSKTAAALFARRLCDSDPELFAVISREEIRQRTQIELIAPKNYMSRAARDAMGSIMGFTSVEGYPGQRYHAGVGNIDAIETLAIERAKRVFGAAHANVQPHSGTQANQGVYFAFAEPGDSVLSMELSAGGHLSHGLKTNLSGKWFRSHFYRITPQGLIDYDHMRSIARAVKPKLIIVGGSSYPRRIEFETVAAIAREVGAISMADVSHFAGLIAAGCYPSPFPHMDIVTSTTNKNLRGPRGGLILARTTELGKRIDSAIFPGTQGGPLPEMITAKAVCLGEALSPEYRDYAIAVLSNARALSASLAAREYDVVSGGTDTPLVVIDLRRQGVTGASAQQALEAVGITCNKNLVPFDTRKPSITSGIRFGVSAVTTRGMFRPDMENLADLIASVLDAIALNAPLDFAAAAKIRESTEHLAARFPIYPD